MHFSSIRRPLAYFRSYVSTNGIREIDANCPKSAIRSLFAILSRVAPTDAAVLLEGGTGIENEALASTVHRLSFRASQPFVIVNCAARSPERIELELFGCDAVKGTRARRSGAFEKATGGTLFLDEIDELTPQLQVKMLGVLEHKYVRRMDSSARIPVDVRVIAATRRDVHRDMDTGRFRRDLYFRIAVVHILTSALRTHSEELLDAQRRAAR